MGDDEPKKRWIPVPIDYRLLDEKPLKKAEIMQIRNNLDELTDIKREEIKKENIKQEVHKQEVPNAGIESVIKSNINSDINSIKPNFGISANSNSSFPKFTTEKSVNIENDDKNKVNTANVDKINDKISNKNSDKINNRKGIIRKVNYMSNDEEGKIIEKIYNVSPEDRKRSRKEDYRELREEEKVSNAIITSADLAEQNRRELAELKAALSKDREELRLNLSRDKEELSNKFNSKFEQFNSKFDKVGEKLEETCTGIDCLKRDFAANAAANAELSECPECGEKVVPSLASYCPNCSAKISGWTEDDGVTPVKNWKPSWNK